MRCRWAECAALEEIVGFVDARLEKNRSSPIRPAQPALAFAAEPALA
jgi:hypothetical protein